LFVEFFFYFAAANAMSVSVCLSICLSVCPCLYCIYHKPHVQTSRNFRYVSTVAVARSSSDDNALCISDFVDDVMFAHNRPGRGDANMAYTQSLTGSSIGDEV